MAKLREGEDFGQLALLNDAPRAATIILREDNCHFLRVDKQDYIRILKVDRRLKPRDEHALTHTHTPARTPAHPRARACVCVWRAHPPVASL